MPVTRLPLTGFDGRTLSGRHRSNTGSRRSGATGPVFRTFDLARALEISSQKSERGPIAFDCMLFGACLREADGGRARQAKRALSLIVSRRSRRRNSHECIVCRRAR